MINGVNTFEYYNIFVPTRKKKQFDAPYYIIITLSKAKFQQNITNKRTSN